MRDEWVNPSYSSTFYFSILLKAYVYPNAFLKNVGDIAIASVRLCVTLIIWRYLLLNHWTKSNQIWCVSCSHEWCYHGTFFLPAPWGPGEGPKGQISLNFNYKVNFKDFLTKLCVSFYIWKIQNIPDGIFIWPPGSCPRGGTWGCHGGVGGVKKMFLKFNQIWCVSFLHEWHMHQRHFLGLHRLGPWGGAKRSNIIKSEL